MASKKGESQENGSNPDDKPIKVDKWDGSAVKNALDDAVKKVFTEKLNYIESHRLMDGRLMICSIAVGAAMFALVWDYLHPFPESKLVLIICVVSYFVLMGILTLYTTILEKGIFLIAYNPDHAGIDPDDVWTVSSSLKRFDDMYQIMVSYAEGKTGKVREAKFEKSIANWFDENGVLLSEIFDPEVTKLHNSLTSEKKGK